ncbi:hypothetical protein GF1_03450 [Desulfolithobacter dissulfuricans]|uniref:histidine kinase n=1 Tax=Desulfolithobacter dissulfuricans TaxID=2795293 RepID=A0A915XGX5_9BACT|nr:PAS domain-containing sensor histidine kinase [Desulfolithobacter dissulfuricans]BCO07969.1 hypothetical protein GF1_03450 [Desulfolithobacter dissulfuricans]
MMKSEDMSAQQCLAALDKARDRIARLEEQVRRLEQQNGSPGEDKRFTMAMDLLDAMVCVTDITTREILFLNRSGRQRLSGGVEGVCWRLLFPDRDQPCDHCPGPELLDKEGGPAPIVSRTLHNPLTGERFQCRTRAIPWPDGRLVRLEIVTPVDGDGRVVEDQDAGAVQEKNVLLEQFETIINTIPYIICLKDGEGRWLLANNHNLELFGLAGVSYRGKTDAELARCSSLYRDNFLRCVESDNRVWEEGRTCREKRIVSSPDGDSHVYDLVKIPLFNEDGCRRALIVTGRDITEQTRVEEILRQGKEAWEKTFDAITDIITIQDMKMRIVRANRAAGELCGTHPKHLIGTTCYAFLLGRTSPCQGCPVEETRRDGQFHNRIMNYDSSDRFFDVSSSPVLNQQGEMIFIVHVARDITDQMKAEEDRRRLSAAIEQAAETVVITDADGTIQYANPAFERVTGYSCQEVIGQNPRILQSGKHDAAFYSELWNTITRGEVWHGHIINRAKNGSLFEEEVTISPVRNSSGRISNYVAVKRDVTREAELENQLRQAMKMEAIGTLAGGIAHDFNNILSAILGYAEVMKIEAGPHNPLCRDLDKIIQAARRAADLVRQILAFSRQGRNEMRPVRMQYILKEVLKLLRRSFPATILFEEDIDLDCGSILADPSQMHQVMMNLCTNARHAMGQEGGILRVGLHQDDFTDEAAERIHRELSGGTYLHLEVHDTGCGMEPELLDRIFDPFFTTKEKGQGTGLGLSVVHGIVANHNGVITVESQLGHGAEFHVYLPVLKEEATLSDAGGFRDVPGGSEHILFVDDEKDIGEITRRILRNLGYKVTTFSSSSETLTLFERNPDGFDLVITDMMMPEMTGLTLARKILAIRPGLPVILCSGFSEVVDREKARRYGIREYLMKPLLRDDLARTIRKVLD